MENKKRRRKVEETRKRKRLVSSPNNIIPYEPYRTSEYPQQSTFRLGTSYIVYLSNSNKCWLYWSQSTFGFLCDHVVLNQPYVLMPINLPINSNINITEYVITIECGPCHFAMLTNMDNCYMYGLGQDGECDVFDIPVMLKLPENKKIKTIKCGFNYTLCVTKCDSIYSWGFEQGINRSSPITLLSFHKKVTFISCGYFHTILLSTDSCYVFGLNKCGELGKIYIIICHVFIMRKIGLCDYNNRTNPTVLNLPNNEIVKHVSAGRHFTICVTTTGKGYSFGNNEFGQLGIRDDNHVINLYDKSVSNYNHLKNVCVPSLVLMPKDELIHTTESGEYHTACITRSGRYFVWGHNSHGQLGLATESTRFKPTLLYTLDKDIITFHCGATTTSCITRKGECYVWGDNKCYQLSWLNVQNYLIPTLFDVVVDNESIKSLPYYWSRPFHKRASSVTRGIIKMLLTLNLRKNERPRFPKCLISWLPREILLHIFTFLPLL